MMATRIEDEQARRGDDRLNARWTARDWPPNDGPWPELDERSLRQPFGPRPPAPVYAGKGPRGWKRTDDRLLEDVCDRLAADGWVDATEVAVGVLDGEVTLEGTVPTRDMKRRAEDCAAATPGVQDVQNRLRIAPRTVPRAD
jgi:hypothetical protein